MIAILTAMSPLRSGRNLICTRLSDMEDRSCRLSVPVLDFIRVERLITKSKGTPLVSRTTTSRFAGSTIQILPVRVSAGARTFRPVAVAGAAVVFPVCVAVAGAELCAQSGNAVRHVSRQIPNGSSRLLFIISTLSYIHLLKF